MQQPMYTTTQHCHYIVRDAKIPLRCFLQYQVKNSLFGCCLTASRVETILLDPPVITLQFFNHHLHERGQLLVELGVPRAVVEARGLTTTVVPKNKRTHSTYGDTIFTQQLDTHTHKHTHN